MCDAEDDLRSANSTLAWMEQRLDDIMDLVADCERGIIDATELRQKVERLPAHRVASYAR